MKLLVVAWKAKISNRIENKQQTLKKQSQRGRDRKDTARGVLLRKHLVRALAHGHSD